MRLERIESLDDPRVSAYRDIRERDLMRRDGLFIAEGRFVVGVLLGPRSLYEPRSVLVTPAALDAMGGVLEPLDDQVPIYVAEQAIMSGVVGFDIHRGCLAAAARPEPVPAESLVASLETPPPGGREVVVVLEGVNNHDNVGGILRSAAAFGAGAVLLNHQCADPLYRKAIRVSMGGALVVPTATFEQWPDGLDALAAHGFALVALAPDAEAPDIAEAAKALAGHERLALVLGAEGPGLSAPALDRCAARARIPMRHDLADSLNVATAAAIALHRFTEGHLQ